MAIHTDPERERPACFDLEHPRPINGLAIRPGFFHQSGLTVTAAKARLAWPRARGSDLDRMALNSQLSVIQQSTKR